MPHADDARLSSGRRPTLVLATLAVVALFALLIGWVAFFGDAKDGHPQVTVALPPATGAPTQVASAGPPRLVNGNLVADPALIESTPLGPLPKIGADGRTAMAAYARPVDAAVKRPRIAIVLSGLGISAAETARALERLPPTVTFAFSPYAQALQSLVDTARGKGHEVLVEIPMEPFDFPDSDPGPRTLIASAPADENEQRLVWTLTRFTGYAGAVNSQGGRFLSEAHALEPVVGFLAKHGVLWVDVSSGDNSATAGAIARQKAAAVAGAMRIDAIQTPEAINEKLLDLEARAKQAGMAVGVASAYPVSIDRLADWAARVEADGFQLVPVSATAKHPAAATGGP